MMRKLAVLAGLAAAVAAWPAVVEAATIAYKATLSGAAESPPAQTSGSGSGTVNVDTATRQLNWRVEYSGLSGPAIAAHIHCGAPPGGNAGVALPLGTSPNWASPLQGTGTMTEAQLAQLQGGMCYINVHTEKFRPGELRGQLAP